MSNSTVQVYKVNAVPEVWSSLSRMEGMGEKTYRTRFFYNSHLKPNDVEVALVKFKLELLESL